MCFQLFSETTNAFYDSNGLRKQAIGYQKEIKKTLGKTSETDAYLKFEMTSYVKCQTDL